MHFAELPEAVRRRGQQQPIGGLEVRMRAPHADQEPCDLIGARGKTDRVADPTRGLEIRAAPAAVFERVHRTARLAGLGLGTRRPLPRLPAANESRLPCATFGRPAFWTALRAAANCIVLPALQVFGHPR